MQTARAGDRVQVHYIKRMQNGSVVSSRSRGDGPLEVTVGVDHPRLPGLGMRLVGLAPGEQVSVTVPADKAYGPHDPGRIRRVPRTRLSGFDNLPIGHLVQVVSSKGRRRSVRILEVRDHDVVVDINHPWAGQSLELKVKMVAIQAPPSLRVGH